MTTVTYVAPDISCGHCQATIEKEIAEVAGVSSVKVDVPTKQVTIQYDEGAVQPTKLEEALDEAGYPVQK